MLNSLRRGMKSLLFKLLLGLMVASFAVWGMGDVFRSAIDSSVAVVGGERITAAEFVNEYDRQLRTLQAQFGADLDSDTARQLGLTDQVVNRMVVRTAFDLDAARKSMRVSNDRVRRKILANDLFHNDFGDFDNFRYASILGQMRLTEPVYIESTRNDIIREQLITAITGGAGAPGALAEVIYRRRTETRSAEYIVLNNSSVRGLGSPSEEDLMSYYQEHGEEFRSPEYRTLSYIAINAAMLAPNVDVPEAELRLSYDRRQAEFGQPERRGIQQLIYAGEAAARDAYSNLMEGADILVIAAEKDGSSAEDILLGTLTYSEFFEQAGADVAAAVFNLAEGAVAEPIESAFGWHVYRVAEIEAADIRSFEDVREELRQTLAKEKAVDEMYEIANQLDDALAGGTLLEDAAAVAGLNVRKLADIDRTGRNIAGNEVQGVPDRQPLLASAFEKEEGDDLFLDETAEGGYFVVRVDSVTPSEIKPFETVRSEVADGWLANARENAGRDRAQRLMDAANSGADFAALAETNRAEIESAVSFQRNGSGARANMSREIIDALFAIESGYALAPSIGQDGYIVAKLGEVTPGDPAADRPAYDRLVSTLRGEVGNDVMAQYQGALNEEFDVQINSRIIEAVFDNSLGVQYNRYSN